MSYINDQKGKTVSNHLPLLYASSYIGVYLKKKMKSTLAPRLSPSIPTVNKQTPNPKRVSFSDPDLTKCFCDSAINKTYTKKVSAVALVSRLCHPGCRIYVYFPRCPTQTLCHCNTRLNVSWNHP